MTTKLDLSFRASVGAALALWLAVSAPEVVATPPARAVVPTPPARPVAAPSGEADTLWSDAERPSAIYRAFVANESSDILSVVRFGPEGAEIERDIDVGIMPADLDGAHGVRVSADGRFVYVSLAHGTPFGRLWKYRADRGALLDSVTVGLFPATIALTPDGGMGFVVNFNLHGDPVPSSVSAVFLPEMVEVARIDTCVMPHGSRLNHAATRHYSLCMMDDYLVEISVERLQVRRAMKLTPGAERALTEIYADAETTRMTGGGDPWCGPTWVIPSADDRHLFVACNKNGDVVEIDAETLSVTRRFRGGEGPYNLAATSDGRLLIGTNKSERSVSVFDLVSGEELARIPTTQPITHGVVVTPDDRYALVSNEAIGATRGTVDVIDLEALELVASTEVHHQPGGIDFWRMDPVEP